LASILPQVTKYMSIIMFLYIVYELIKNMYKAYNDTLSYKKINRSSGKSKIKTFLIIFCVAIISRYVLYFFVYLFVYNPANNVSFFDAMSQMLLRSDAPHYIDIMRDFYVTEGNARYFIVFLPFYPAVVSAVNILFNDLVFSAYLVSDICFGIACCFIYELAFPYIGQKAAKHSVILLMLFPVSFFFGGAFTESMFLMLCAIFFYLLDRNKYLGAACAGFFAALTRNVGFLLAVPLIIKLFYDIRPFESKKYGKFIKYACYSLIIASGMGVYLLINKLVYDNPFQFLIYANEHWSQGIGFFPDSISYLTYRAVTDIPFYKYYLFIPELIIIFFVLFTLMYGGKYLSPHYFIYVVFYFYLTMSATWLLSAPRYLMVLFPLYFIWGKMAAESRKACALLYFFFGSALIFMTAAFAMGCPIY